MLSAAACYCLQHLILYPGIIFWRELRQGLQSIFSFGRCEVRYIPYFNNEELDGLWIMALEYQWAWDACTRRGALWSIPFYTYFEWCIFHAHSSQLSRLFLVPECQTKVTRLLDPRLDTFFPLSLFARASKYFDSKPHYRVDPRAMIMVNYVLLNQSLHRFSTVNSRSS